MPADARGHDSVPRASSRGSGRSRNVARLTFDDDVGRGRVSKVRPLPILSLWGAGVVHHLPEVVEAAARSAETAEQRVRESKQRPVLIELAEVADGVTWNVVPD